GGAGGGNAFILLLLTLLACALPARAEFSLDDYTDWQQYNSWPIKVIEFPGIESFARDDLLSVMATEKPTWLRRYIRLGSRTTFWADDFASDILRVENFYHREGFPNAIVKGYVYPLKKHNELRLKFEIEEGPPLILEHWFITMGSDSGAGVDSARWSSRMPIKVGKRLSLSDVATSADTLRYRLKEIGHARARVEYTIQVDSTNNSAVVEFILYPGSFCYLGQTRIRGLKQVSEGTARRELTYHEGEPFAPSALAATRRRLLRLETFRMVRTDVDLTQPSDTLTVFIHTEEGNRYKIRTGGGYGTLDRAHVQTEFSDLNFFGRARRFSVLARVSEISRKIEGRLFWPHTPWNATDITLVPAWKLETSPVAVESKTGTSILSASPLEKTSISLSNEVGRETVRDSTETTISIETLSLSWDTRDNPLIPRQGHLITFAVSESGAFYRTTNRWWRVNLHGRVLIPANKFTVFAAKAEGGVMGPAHDSNVTPINERLYLGGTASVRGWGSNKLSPRDPNDINKEIGGNFDYTVSTEIRRDIWGPVGLILFADAGNVWKDIDEADIFNLYTAAGLGLRFLTMVGPIRIDGGYQLRPNPYDEPRFAIHLSLGSTF
ncbi:BamA/TamA family outer membrane protein, partial [bacterium]|nr:BamA/TamA family outer membrane protein [bacterium]